MKRWLLSLLLSSLLLTDMAHADTEVICKGKMINPATDICWTCLFPITIGSYTIKEGDLPDTDNPEDPICECGEWPYEVYGLALGYWEPMALVDVTRTPYCVVSWGGKKINNDPKKEEIVDTHKPEQINSFYYVHYFNYPILRWAEGNLLGGACRTDGEFFTPSYFSELDPTWNDEELAATVFPETKLFSNPVSAFTAGVACVADSAIADTSLPRDSSFWCAGSHGFMYPMSGEVSEYVTGLQAKTLLSERAVFKLHRLGMIRDTNENHLCSELMYPIMPKSHYRYQMTYPAVKKCEPFGRTTTLWEINVEKVTDGDDAGFLIWRKRNCCRY